MISQVLYSSFKYLGFGLLTIFCIYLAILPISPNVIDYFIKINIAFALLSLILAVGLPRKISLILCPAVFVVTTAYRLSSHIASLRQILLNANAGEVVFHSGNFFISSNFFLGCISFFIITFTFVLLVLKCSKIIIRCSFDFSSKTRNILKFESQSKMDSILKKLFELKGKIPHKKYAILFENQRIVALSKVAKFIRVEAFIGVVLSLISMIGGYAVGTLFIGMSPSEAILTYCLLGFGEGIVFLIPSFLTVLAALMITSSSPLEYKSHQGKQFRDDPIISKVFSKLFLLASGVFLIFAIEPLYPVAPLLILAGFFGLMAFIAWSFVIRKTGTQSQEIELDSVFEKVSGTSDTVDIIDEVNEEISEEQANRIRFHWFVAWLIALLAMPIEKAVYYFVLSDNFDFTEKNIISKEILGVIPFCIWHFSLYYCAYVKNGIKLVRWYVYIAPAGFLLSLLLILLNLEMSQYLGMSLCPSSVNVTLMTSLILSIYFWFNDLYLYQLNLSLQKKA